MISSNDLRKGTVIELDGDLFIVTYMQHHKPGKGQAVVRTKIKNITKNTVIDKTFRAGEKLKSVNIEKTNAQYLYNDGENYVFMDLESYEQEQVPETMMADSKNFLLENMEVILDWYDGQVISVNLPNFVEMKIQYTEPGLKGDTVSNTTKKAELETGYIINVPLFINTDDKIRVDTRTGEYMERV